MVFYQIILYNKNNTIARKVIRKMKKNQKGFVLAETLVVTVFVMCIFTLIYSNFYPLIGEYEKREDYDTVDGKYAVFWIKNIIEASSYKLYPETTDEEHFNTYGYVRFSCSNITEANPEEGLQSQCKRLVKEMSINGCNSSGENCDIFITKYQIGNSKNDDASCSEGVCFKKTVRTNAEDQFDANFQDYVEYLPNYEKPSTTEARYRVIAIIHHERKGLENTSYTTMEVR